MVQNLYYRHSGQFALGRVILGTIAAAATGSLLAVAYAASVLYIPFAGVVSFILSIGFGVLLGLTTTAALRWAKVRHEGIAFLSSATAASSAFYVSWAVWTWLLLRQADVESHLSALVQEPGVVWGLLGEVNAVGAWSMGGFTPTGAVLWVLWGFEALLILVPAVLLPLGVLAVPFCERCNLWCEPTEDVARLAACEPSQLKSHMDAEELNVLAVLFELGTSAEDDDTWIRVDLHDCPSCGNLHTMTLKSISVPEAAAGEHHQTELEVANHLLLSTEQAQRIRVLARTFQPEPVEAA